MKIPLSFKQFLSRNYYHEDKSCYLQKYNDAVNPIIKENNFDLDYLFTSKKLNNQWDKILQYLNYSTNRKKNIGGNSCVHVYDIYGRKIIKIIYKQYAFDHNSFVLYSGPKEIEYLEVSKYSLRLLYSDNKTKHQITASRNKKTYTFSTITKTQKINLGYTFIDLILDNPDLDRICELDILRKLKGLTHINKKLRNSDIYTYTEKFEIKRWNGIL